MRENKIQAICYQWFNNTFCLHGKAIMFSIPNELAGNNKIATMQAKAMGLKSGVSDTIVILPTGEIIFVEFKDKNGKQSENQKKFEIIVNNLGYKYFVVRSLEEFKKIIYLLLG